MSTLRENIIEALKDELVWKTPEDMADQLLLLIRKAQWEAWAEGCKEGLSTNPGWDDVALARNPYNDPATQ